MSAGRPGGIPEGTSPEMPEEVSGVDATGGISQREVAALEAMQVPTQRVIAIGLVLWVVALVVTLVVPALHTGSRSWWPWACVAGFVLGTLGLLYVRRGRGNAHDAH